MSQPRPGHRDLAEENTDLAVPLIAHMTVADVDAAMVIERRAFQQPWSRHMYLSDLQQNKLATYLVLRPSPEDREVLPPVLAYGGFWLMVDEAHIATIASHPDWRGCGLGQLLLIALLDEAVRRGALRSTLEVRLDNAPAQHIYEKLGYEPAGARRRYYQDGEDALIMTTPLLIDSAMQARLALYRAAAVAHVQACLDTAK
jgi:[ribosomal protein S18]-alanine N-acetyltransferase